MLRWLKRQVRYILGRPRYWWRLFSHLTYDLKRFHKHSSARGRICSQRQLKAWIEADYHKIEKGLSLSGKRMDDDHLVAKRLRENIERYGAGEFPGRGQTIVVTRDEIHARARINIGDFFASRHSIRNFSGEPVEMALIERAVEMALKTPTVCNRQSLKIYAFTGAEKDRVLNLQQGNRGFGAEVQVACVVTSSIDTFFCVEERNQCWVDGGLFSMSFIYALHSLGLGACCLNWCVDRKRDRALHRTASIPENEAVIMMIAVGHIPEKVQVCRSVRGPVSEALIINGGKRDNAALSPE